MNRSRTDLLLKFDEIIKEKGSLRQAERGLPDEHARRDLARTYLEIQNKLWPELALKEVFPRLTEQNVELFSQCLRDVFVRGELSLFTIPEGLVLQIAAAYLRYSCDNSNPRSLDQQLRNVLEGAKKLGYFVPWHYVFADAAMTGTTSDRRGYQLCKELIRNNDVSLDCLLVDEIGRANREMIESLMLGRLVKHYQKRMVGVTDGLDSRHGQFEMSLTIFSMMHEQYVIQLREKVNRGMRDKFENGGNIQPPCLGFKMINVTNPDGSLVIGRNNKIKTVRISNDEELKDVLQAFHWYGLDCWSYERIARDFCRRVVGGSSVWDASGIKNLLNRETYIGREHYRKTRTIRDPETGVYKTIKLPREEWLCREIPAVVPQDLWDAVKRRQAVCSAAYSANKQSALKGSGTSVSRVHAYPRLLVRPLCAYCKKELYFGKSGKHAALCCLHGSRGKNQCPLNTFKSVKIVERAFIGFILKEVITKSFLEGVVKEANAYLETEQSRPRKKVPLEPIGLKELVKRRDSLGALLEEHDAKDVLTLINRLRSLERQIEELKNQHKAEQLRESPPPPLVTLPDVEALIQDLQTLLKDDVAKAAPILRLLFGDIEVEPVKDSNSKRPVWLARFTMNAVPFMLSLAKSRKLPNSESWEYLTQRNWKFSKPGNFTIKEVPIYESIKDEVLRLHAKGLSDEVIGGVLHESYCNVRYARLFGLFGTRPKKQPTKKRTGNGTITKFKVIKEEVARLRDVEGKQMDEIAAQMKCSEATVRRAYDAMHPEVLKLALDKGKRPRRGRSIRLKPEVYAQMQRLIKQNELSNCEIARRCHCGSSTVNRERVRMTLESRSA